jgi:hypothetical protein
VSLTDDQIAGLNIALNEATWLGLSIDADGLRAAATFAVLTLPEDGPVPEDRRAQILMQPLGRVAASYRQGLWNDRDAPISTVSAAELETLTVERPTSVYGWDFFNRSDDRIEEWPQPLSLDLQLDQQHTALTLDLVHDLNPFLHVRLWFSAFRLLTPDREEIDLQEFIDGGKRWWDGLYAGDERASGFGIVPLKPDSEPPDR